MLEIYLITICSFCLTDTPCFSFPNIRPPLLRKWKLFVEEDRNVNALCDQIGENLIYSRRDTYIIYCLLNGWLSKFLCVKTACVNNLAINAMRIAALSCFLLKQEVGCQIWTLLTTNKDDLFSSSHTRTYGPRLQMLPTQ